MSSTKCILAAYITNFQRVLITRHLLISASVAFLIIDTVRFNPTYISSTYFKISFFGFTLHIGIHSFRIVIISSNVCFNLSSYAFWLSFFVQFFFCIIFHSVLSFFGHSLFTWCQFNWYYFACCVSILAILCICLTCC